MKNIIFGNSAWYCFSPFPYLLLANIIFVKNSPSLYCMCIMYIPSCGRGKSLLWILYMHMFVNVHQSGDWWGGSLTKDERQVVPRCAEKRNESGKHEKHKELAPEAKNCERQGRKGGGKLEELENLRLECWKPWCRGQFYLHVWTRVRTTHFFSCPGT